MGDAVGNAGRFSRNGGDGARRGRWGLAVGQAGRGSVCAGCAGGSCAGAAPSPFLSPLPLSLHRLGVNAAWDSFSTTGGGFGGGFWVWADAGRLAGGDWLGLALGGWLLSWVMLGRVWVLVLAVLGGHPGQSAFVNINKYSFAIFVILTYSFLVSVQENLLTNYNILDIIRYTQ